MAEKKEYKEFRKLLRKAIGMRRTQAEFAMASKITPQHLNRLLNNELIGQPSRETLIKIAGCADTPIALEDLLKACDYDTEIIEEVSEKNLENENTEIVKLASKIMNAFSLLTFKTYKSISDFIENVIELVGNKQISYELINNEEIKDDTDKKVGEYVVTAILSWLSENYVNTLDVAIAYVKTINENIIVMETTDRESRINDYYPWNYTEANEISTLFSEPKIKYKIKPSTPENIKDQLSAEERLLKAIFGEGKPQRICSVEGLGFYIDKIPEGAFRRFILNHEKSLPEGKNNKEIIEKYLNSITTKEEAFEGYHSLPQLLGDDYFGGLIASVITKETNIKIECWDNHENMYDANNRPSVMFTENMPWLYSETERSMSYDTLFQILDAYARELRCEIQDCHFIMTVDED